MTNKERVLNIIKHHFEVTDDNMDSFFGTIGLEALRDDLSAEFNIPVDDIELDCFTTPNELIKQFK